jgi:hypothetical protein
MVAFRNSSGCSLLTVRVVPSGHGEALGNIPPQYARGSTRMEYRIPWKRHTRSGTHVQPRHLASNSTARAEDIGVEYRFRGGLPFETPRRGFKSSSRSLHSCFLLCRSIAGGIQIDFFTMVPGYAKAKPQLNCMHH